MKEYILIIAVLAIVLVVVFALWGTPTGEDAGLENDSSYGFFDIFTKQSISTIFHNLIDPVNPTFISTARGSCEGGGGHWKDEHGRMGCFDMPPGLFDATQCVGPIYSAFGNTCNGIDGARWVCNSQNAGCYY